VIGALPENFGIHMFEYLEYSAGGRQKKRMSED
jgi:hypothetical protein